MPDRAVIYTRVSTQHQGEDGLGMAAQRRMCFAACDLLGYEPVAACWDVASGGKARRPGLHLAMGLLDDADVLVVANLARFSRSVRHYLDFSEDLMKRGKKLILADNPVDPSTPMGAFARHILIGVAELERANASERTRAGLGEAKRRGTKLGGDRGVGPRIPEDIQHRIWRDREMGPTWIARDLTACGIPTASGRGSWNHKVVSTVLKRLSAAPPRRV